jgi:predicted TIM-barrel fold metal-dependent hydrolase
MRRTYAHTGSAVFAAHMIASCSDKVLLLPVATPGRTITGQMHEIAKMFGDHKRFSVGCSVPNTIKTANIGDFIKKMIGRFRIKAIKLHPNISEIDISSSDGKERVESLLVASSESDLPVIVHGGRNDVLRDPKTRNYSCIDNLKKINWGVGGYTVVIAHAGALCCTLNEMDQDILPKIKKLLAKHDNLMVDISGLDISALVLVLKEIDHGRILFGSDALYNSQWASVAKLMTALQMAKYKVEKEFIAIASANPAKYIFGR